LDALSVAITRRRVNWVLDADIRDFFSKLDHSWLEKFLEHRIGDKRVLRLIQKWLRAGVRCFPLNVRNPGVYQAMSAGGHDWWLFLWLRW
jgi:hypothetical protein